MLLIMGGSTSPTLANNGGIDVSDLKRRAIDILANPIVKSGLSMLPQVGAGAEKFIDAITPAKLEDQLGEYQSANHAFNAFRNKLSEVAEELAKSSEGKPLIVVIDELDRCRPGYAIELLEVAKHLFNVDRVIFILALDRAQLAHSVRAMYGSEFGAEEYLKRFFDVSFRLPDPEVAPYVSSVLQSTGVIDHLKAQNLLNLYSAFVLFLSRAQFDFRTINQAIHRLELILLSSPIRRPYYETMITSFLILRTMDEQLYLLFIRGETTDRIVMDRLFRSHGTEDLRKTAEGNLVEASILAGFRAMKLTSEILDGYDESAKAKRDRSNPMGAHAGRIMELVHDMGPHMFEGAVHRLEFIAKL